MTLIKPVFYDTDCLECFLFVDAGHILEKLFTKIVIPEQVYAELMDDNTPPIVKTNFKKLKEGCRNQRNTFHVSGIHYL